MQTYFSLARYTILTRSTRNVLWSVNLNVLNSFSTEILSGSLFSRRPSRLERQISLPYSPSLPVGWGGKYFFPFPMLSTSAASRLRHLRVLTCRCLHGLGPDYLSSDFMSVSDLRSRQKLCSASTAALVVPVTRYSTLRDRAFTVIAAKLWNALPGDITSATSLLTFRHKLKTFLFRWSYGAWLFWTLCVFVLAFYFFWF